MGSQRIETTVGVPLAYLVACYQARHETLAQTAVFHAFSETAPLQPLAPWHYRLSVQWHLGGRIAWGTEPFTNGPSQDPPETCWEVPNRGILHWVYQSQETCQLILDMSYDPLSDPTLWACYERVFSPPTVQISQDLAEIRTVLEDCYMEALCLSAFSFPPAPKATASQGVPVMTPAA
jgi:hypothetical protein